MTTDVTIVVAPRERFSRSLESLERIYQLTDTPFELVYVDGGSPRPVQQGLEAAAARHGFTLLRHDHHLAPNHARSIGLARVTTPYVAFVDNDLMVTPGWLDTLLTCAEQTGAWAVGPLYFEGDPADEIIHMAGGDMRLGEGEPGQRTFETTHRLQHVGLADAPGLSRQRCDFVEFHCALVRVDAIERVGGLDDRLLATREHLDLCLRIADAGGEVWFEPASRVTYVTPPPVDLRDVPYFLRRWSEEWSRTSLEHFQEKYGIEPQYLERLRIMRNRRQVAFEPVRRAARKVGGRRAERLTDRVLRKTEPVVNRRLFRPPPAPVPTGAATD